MSDPIYDPKKSLFRQTAVFFVGGVILGGILTTGFFLNKESKQAVSTTDVVGENLFKVDNNVYTSTNLPSDTAMSYYQLENSIYEAKSNFVNQVALRLALSKDNSEASEETLPALEELLSVAPPTDKEMKEYYDMIASRYGKGVFGGQTFESIKPQLAQQLSRQKRDQAVQSKIQELTGNGRIVTLLNKPEAPAVNLNLAGYPTRGNPDASITLVEVSDYMCPHCRETEPAVQKVYEEFKDKVKFVQVSFPLTPQGLNGALARGAYCATQQGQDKFWKYHEHAFQVGWDKITPPKDKDAVAYFNDQANEVARASGLDLTQFNSCLVSEDASKYITQLQSEFNAEKGFQGTPTFYLNNKMIQANPAQIEATLRKTLTTVASR